MLLLLACREPAVEDNQCFGPLSELVRWRDAEEGKRRAGKGLAPVEMRAAEQTHIGAAVAALRPHADHCAAAWRMGLWSTTDNPGMRVRDEALRAALGEAAVTYPPAAWEGAR